MANQYKNKVVYNGTTLIDLSDTTAVQSDVASGKYFYMANGQKVEGTASGGDEPVTLISKTITVNGTYDAINDSADGYSSVTVNVENNIPTTWEIKSYQGINITSDGTYNYAIWTYTEPLQANETYRITWGENGTEYICKTVADSSGSSPVYDGYYLGNASIVSVGEDTGEPFILYRNSSTRMVVTTTQSTGSWYIKVEKQVPLLMTKTITSNGTYLASDDDVSGYSEVVVNVSSGSSGLQIENIIPEQTINCTIAVGTGYGNYIQSYTATSITGAYYLVTLDNIEYIARAFNANANMICIGDIRVSQGYEYTNFPFEVIKEGNAFYLVVAESGECTLKVDKILSW